MNAQDEVKFERAMMLGEKLQDALLLIGSNLSRIAKTLAMDSLSKRKLKLVARGTATIRRGGKIVNEDGSEVVDP